MFAVSLPSEANGNGKQNNKVSIIDMMNAKYSMSNAPGKSSSSSTGTARSRSSSISSTVTLDERDAARAMLGISPCSVADSSIMGGRGASDGLGKSRQPKAGRSPGSAVVGHSSRRKHLQQATGAESGAGGLGSFLAPATTASACFDPSRTGNDAAPSMVGGRRPRSNSAGLDALAFLATQEQEASTVTTATRIPSNKEVTVPYSEVSLVPKPAVTSSDDDDSEIMPPPPPRTTTGSLRRRRSVSNPEGMGDKWGLPPGLAPRKSSTTTVRRLRLVLPLSILEEEMTEADAAVLAKQKSTASASALAASLLRSDAANHHRVMNLHREQLPKLVEEEEAEDGGNSEEDEENLDHGELLRRARSRLLEDLSQSNLSGAKGGLTLPHSLRKYKEVYNKNGRIGIYTPAERAAIIARYQSKKTRRVWNKKIRYNCRKNLADRRLRVKGRFVKRSVTETPKPPSAEDANAVQTRNAPAANAAPSLVTSSIPEESEIVADSEMPDVSDPDAGFCPTDAQPYRRLRRHTIT